MSEENRDIKWPKFNPAGKGWKAGEWTEYWNSLTDCQRQAIRDKASWEAKTLAAQHANGGDKMYIWSEYKDPVTGRKWRISGDLMDPLIEVKAESGWTEFWLTTDADDMLVTVAREIVYSIMEERQDK